MSATSDPPVQELALEHGVLRYREAGTGPPLVYLHGLEPPHWSPALAELARSYHVYAPDLPGCGRSAPLEDPDGVWPPDGPSWTSVATDVLLQFVQAVVADGTPHLVGSSVAATLALGMALRWPEGIERLVLVSPTTLLPPGEDPTLQIWGPRMVSAFYTLIYAHPERHPVSIEYGIEDLSQMLAVTPMLWLLSPRRKEDGAEALLDRLQEVDTPVLALFGTRDRLVPGETARLYRERLPHCQVTFVYNAGHEIAADRPDAFVRLVDEFLTYGEAFVRNYGSTGYLRAPTGTTATGQTPPTGPRSH